jgi:hypothetical protein
MLRELSRCGHTLPLRERAGRPQAREQGGSRESEPDRHAAVGDGLTSLPESTRRHDADTSELVNKSGATHALSHPGAGQGPSLSVTDQYHWGGPLQLLEKLGVAEAWVPACAWPAPGRQCVIWRLLATLYTFGS